MLKKTITYEDFEGNEVSEDFYFHLSEAELAEMEMSKAGGMEAHLLKLIQASDAATIIGTFKEIIGSAVGRKSEDGKRFIKNDQYRSELFDSPAWSVMFMELINDEDSGANFVKAVVPPKLAQRIEERNTAPNDASQLVELPQPTPETVVHNPDQKHEETSREKYDRLLQDVNWEPSQQDLVLMDKDQMQVAFQNRARREQ